MTSRLLRNHHHQQARKQPSNLKRYSTLLLVSPYRCTALTSFAPTPPCLPGAALRVLIYSGTTDGVMPTGGTRAWLDALGLPPGNPFRPWNDRLAWKEVCDVHLFQGCCCGACCWRRLSWCWSHAAVRSERHRCCNTPSPPLPHPSHLPCCCSPLATSNSNKSNQLTPCLAYTTNHIPPTLGPVAAGGLPSTIQGQPADPGHSAGGGPQRPLLQAGQGAAAGGGVCDRKALPVRPSCEIFL